MPNSNIACLSFGVSRLVDTKPLLCHLLGVLSRTVEPSGKFCDSAAVVSCSLRNYHVSIRTRGNCRPDDVIGFIRSGSRMFSRLALRAVDLT